MLQELLNAEEIAKSDKRLELLKENALSLASHRNEQEREIQEFEAALLKARDDSIQGIFPNQGKMELVSFDAEHDLDEVRNCVS